MSLILDYIKQILPSNWKSNPKGWISGNCPMCHLNGESRPDTKRRGGAIFENGGFRFHCFNCGYVAGWSPGARLNNRLKRFLMQLGADESDVHRLQLELLREDDFQAIVARTTKKTTEITIDWKPVQLPDNAKPLSECDVTPDFITVANYVHARGLDVTDPRFYYSPSKIPGRMNKRVILAFTYKGENVGYIARYAGDVPPGLTKYYRNQPDNFVFGLDQQSEEHDFVIVTEGELDAIITKGVAIGSNNMSREQGDIIDSLDKQVILLPDADPASIKLIELAVERGWHVTFPEWENCKDVGDAILKYGVLFSVKSILDNAIDNPTKIRVLAKKYCR